MEKPLAQLGTLEVTRTTRMAVMNENLMSKLRVRIWLLSGERSIDRATVLSVHDDNGIEMMMSF